MMDVRRFRLIIGSKKYGHFDHESRPRHTILQFIKHHKTLVTK